VNELSPRRHVSVEDASPEKSLGELGRDRPQSLIMSRFVYREIQPHAELAPFVRTLWTIDAADCGDPRDRVEEIHPDGCVEWILQFGDPFYSLIDGELVRQGTHLIAGPSSTTGRFARGATTAALGVRFAPGAGRLLGLPSLASLRDSVVDAADVVGREWLAVPDELARHAPRERARRVEVLLLERIQDMRARAYAAPIVFAAEAIGAGRRVSEVAREIGLSERSLERRFESEVGGAPAHLRGVARFQRAIGLLADPSLRLAAVAQRAGYSDEAHLCREFRRHAGRTPADFRRSAAAMTLAFGGSAVPSCDRES
jgi:AraC-like DNA-binding protein